MYLSADYRVNSKADVNLHRLQLSNRLAYITKRCFLNRLQRQWSSYSTIYRAWQTSCSNLNPVSSTSNPVYPKPVASDAPPFSRPAAALPLPFPPCRGDILALPCRVPRQGREGQGWARLIRGFFYRGFGGFSGLFEAWFQGNFIYIPRDFKKKWETWLIYLALPFPAVSLLLPFPAKGVGKGR